MSDCNIVCEGSFVTDDIHTAANLEALSGCTTVTGDISIEYSPLTSLEGLECLAHVGGRLDIKLNDSLTSLAGLNNLKSVGGNLGIWYNGKLCTSWAEALRDRLLDSGGWWIYTHFDQQAGLLAALWGEDELNLSFSLKQDGRVRNGSAFHYSFFKEHAELRLRFFVASSPLTPVIWKQFKTF